VDGDRDECVCAVVRVGGAVAVQRDEHLLARVIGMARRAARPGQAILFAVDGFKSYVRIILRTFRHNADAPGWWWTAHRPGH